MLIEPASEKSYYWFCHWKISHQNADLFLVDTHTHTHTPRDANEGESLEPKEHW